MPDRRWHAVLGWPVLWRCGSCGATCPPGQGQADHEQFHTALDLLLTLVSGIQQSADQVSEAVNALLTGQGALNVTRQD